MNPFEEKVLEITSRWGRSLTGKRFTLANESEWQEVRKQVKERIADTQEQVCAVEKWLDEAVCPRVQFTDIPFNETDEAQVLAAHSATAAQNTDMDKVRQYVSLKKRADELDAELKDVKNRMAELEPELERFFVDNGIQKQSVDGRTVYIANEVWASANGDKQAACDALVVAGLGEYVSPSFNSQSLSAWFREQYKEWMTDHPLGAIEQFKATLHPLLQETIKVSETHKIKVRKG